MRARMKPVPTVLVEAYMVTFRGRAEPDEWAGAYLMWLRFYLDFCHKYQHPPRDADSLQPFLHKLAARNQSREKQEQAARAVKVYYETMKGWGAGDSISNIQCPISNDQVGSRGANHRGPQRFIEGGGEGGEGGGGQRSEVGGPGAGDGKEAIKNGGLRIKGAGDSISNDQGGLSTGGALGAGEEQSAGDEQSLGDWEWVMRRLKEEIRIRQYSPKTWKTYRVWTGQFQKFLGEKQPSAVTADDARRFLTYLVTDRRVVASTQNQAFNSLLFVYRHILKVDYDLKDKVVRARRTRYIPVVLTREEVERVIGQLDYPYSLMVGVLYGCGLRLFECLNLRVGCLDFGNRILTVHDGKGKKDRTVPLPEKLVPELEKHVQRVENLHRMDVEAAYAGVFMPGALDNKWRRKIPWIVVFSAKRDG